MTAYASLEQIKSYLDIALSNTDDDDLLTMALDNASAVIDTQTHRTYVSEADETHYHDALCDVHGRRLWLRGDLAQLVSITNGDGADVPATAYVTEPSIGGPYYAIVLKANSGIAWTYSDTPEEAIGVNGRWAYSVLPPGPIVQATIRLAAWMYRQRDNANDLDRALIVGNTTITPSQVPVDVMLMLKPYLKRI